MEEITKTESLALCRFLDSLELSHDEILARRSLFFRLETLAGAVDFIPDFQPTTVTGSTIDGVSWKGYMADLDTMVLISYATVFEDPQTAEAISGHVFQLCTENVHPGYARLRLIKEWPLQGNNMFSVTPSGVKSFCLEENGNLFLSAFKVKAAFNRYIQLPEKPAWVVQTSYMYGVRWPDDEEILEHGPALCFTDTSKDEPSSDTVPSFSCPVWPKMASEWVTRKRTHWPRQEDVQRVVKDGCRVVPVGFRASHTRHLEWRLSFTLSERFLIKTFNITQYKCYALLKMFLKEIIDKMVPDVLSSFNMKNTLLWTIEQTTEDLWRPENLTLAFMECLKKLTDWVREGVCPSYFVISNNVFESKVVGEDQERLIRLLDNQTSKNWRCLLTCESIQHDQSFLTMMGNGEKGLDEILQTMHAKSPSTVWFEHDTKFFQRLEDARTELFTSLDFSDDIALAIAAHYQMIDKLEGERSPTPEHREVIRPLVQSVKTSLGSHLLSYHIGQFNKPGEDCLKLAREYLEEGKDSDATSGILKLANFYLMVGDYKKCLDLTESVTKQTHLLMTNIPQFFPKFIGPTDAHLDRYQAYVKPDTPLEERYQTSSAHAVIFFQTEYNAAPDAVKFQLNSPVPKEMEYTSWLKWAIFNPLVYTHFLRSVCYRKLGQEAESLQELKTIEEMLNNEETGYEVSALNLLGYSYVETNQIEKAMYFLLLAKEKALMPDATLWQLGGSLTNMLHPRRKNWKVHPFDNSAL